jgi:GR25 family glycosyltransferase involved in LPS biosynthesis
MRTFVINLAERTDRWDRVKPQLDAVNQPYERFEAIKGGWKGCRDSHLAVLNTAKGFRWHDKYRHILILEDDVDMIPEWRQELMKVLMHTPLDWDIIYLGASPQAPLERYNDHLYVAKNCLCTHAMLYNNSHKGVVDYILEHRAEINKIDVFYKDVIQEKFKCFLTFPLISTQWDDKSNTCTRSDISTIAKNYLKYAQ